MTFKLLINKMHNMYYIQGVHVTMLQTLGTVEYVRMHGFSSENCDRERTI